MNYLNKSVGFALDTSENPHDEAIALFNYLRDRLGWAGTLFTRVDVEAQLERELTDEEWEAVSATKVWRDMGSMMCESGAWEWVDMAIQDSGINDE